MPAAASDLRRTLGPGELVRLAYRLGHQAASGVLTLAAGGAGTADRPDVLVLRRGAAVCGSGEPGRRALMTRLARAAAEPAIAASFAAGVTAYPPGAPNQVPLAGWARTHLEGQLDGGLAEAVLRELTGVRVALRPELAPLPTDEADRRMLDALAEPRQLDQIWPLARTPRFRLLAFLHFLRGVGALAVDQEGAFPPPLSRQGRDIHPSARRVARLIEPAAARRPAAPASAPVAAPAAAPVALRLDPRRAHALQLLGVDDAADLEAIKRAYRRLARALHPDLQPGADAPRRQALERRFAEVTAAYEALTG